jgi:hypothetical protein
MAINTFAVRPPIYNNSMQPTFSANNFNNTGFEDMVSFTGFSSPVTYNSANGYQRALETKIYEPDQHLMERIFPQGNATIFINNTGTKSTSPDLQIKATNLQALPPSTSHLRFGSCSNS